MIKDKENAADTANSDSSSYFQEFGQGCQSEAPVKKKKKFLSPKNIGANKSVPLLPERPLPVTVSEAVSKLECISQNILQDEFETFGQHVANQLRNLPIMNAITCEHYIHNYLAQERIKVLSDTLIHLATSRPVSSDSDYIRDTLIRLPTSRPVSSDSDYTRDTLIRLPTSRPVSSDSDYTRDTLIRLTTSRPVSSDSDYTRNTLIRLPTSRPVSSASDNTRDTLICGSLNSFQLPNATITSSAYECKHDESPHGSPDPINLDDLFNDSAKGEKSEKGKNINILSQARRA